MKIRLVLGIFGIVAVAMTARADINPNFDSFGFNGTTTTWNYTADVTADQVIVTGDFFTIYDFGNFIQGTNLQPTDWTFSSALTGVTPPGINGPAIDDPTLLNLTWTYTGTATIPTDTLGIGLFSVQVPGAENTQERDTFFAGYGTRMDGEDEGGTNIANVGNIVVPVVAVPEPPTMTLIFASGGLAIVGRAFLARFRR